MAYIGVPPADRTSGARVRDEFTADGTQVCFQLSQEVPGSFESNIIAVVENVIQEPVSAYIIVNTVTVGLTSISGTFTKNETVTGGTSAATGTVIQVNTSSIVIKVVSGTFQAAETITGGGSSATATISSLTTNVGRGLNFTGAPSSGAKVYVLHQAAATYNVKPAAGSVTPETLSDNLRTFTVDKFTATASQTAFTLSATPVSVKSILVFVDGVMQTETTHYTLSAATLTMGSALASGQQVTVVHLGFSTVSRTAFTDGSVTTNQLADGAVTTAKIPDGAITSAKIANGTVIAADVADGTITLQKLSATGTADSTKFLRGDNSWQVVAVTPTAVSDQANTSTGYFDVPSGTTAQRPVSPSSGAIRFNTSNSSLEFFDGSTWISTNLIPYINSISGAIYAGLATSLTFSLSNSTDTVTVRFAEGGVTLKDVTGVTVSGGSTTVSVPVEVYSQTAGDSISVSVINQDGTPSSNAITKTVAGLPTGGTITTSSGYRYHAFTTSGTFSTVGFAGSVNYLIVAGGGGGGGYNGGGGGGAGGYLSGTTSVSSSTTLSITIGGGGAGGTNSGSGASSDGGTSGTDTTVSGFLSLTAIGGGGGGGAANTASFSAAYAKSGGSGGGATGSSSGVVNAGASGTAGQGNAGGTGYHNGGYHISGGGGGGAGAAGSNGSQTTTGKGGDGGVGSQWLNGTYYSGGGGGGTHAVGSSAGAGGTGGGGNGAWQSNNNGSAGSTNTGGGGGGSGNSGYGPYSGGSGIVIVRYAIPT